MPKSTNPTPVYFTSLEIRNVRCFGRRQVLRLTADRGRPARWTLILGDNGVGKTTLLECLTWMRPVPKVDLVSELHTEGVGSPERDDGEGEALSKGRLVSALAGEENDVLERLLRVGSTNITIRADLSFDRTLASIGDESNERRRRGDIIKTGARLRFDKAGLSGYEEIGNSLRIDALGGEFHDPLVVAYGANRQLGVLNLAKGDLDPIDSRLAGATELYDIEEILSSLDYAEKSKGDDSQESRELKRLLGVITRILPQNFEPKHVRIYPPNILNRGDPGGPHLIDFSGLPIPFSGLSLGYQTTLAWTVDLAWRLMRHYKESKDPLAQPAVVLIDEIDLHLHPLWQLSIIDDLSAIFTGTQFIATSHSPLMAQVAETANFAVLRKRGTDIEIVNDPKQVRSWRVDQILTSELFGVLRTRNRQTEVLLKRRDELLDKEHPSAPEEAEMEVLRTKISQLDTAEYPDDQKAMDFIRRAAERLSKEEVSET